MPKWAKKIGSHLPYIGTTILEIDLAPDQAQGPPNYRDNQKQLKDAYDFVEECSNN